MGGFQQTPELTKIRMDIEVWRLVVSKIKGCMVSACTILGKRDKAGLGNVNINVSEEFASQQGNIHFIRYKEYLTECKEQRHHFQDKLAQARANEGKNKVATEIDRMERTKAQRIIRSKNLIDEWNF